MIGILAAIMSVLYCAVAVLLIWKFRATRDAGFLWLGLPLVVLPFVALPITLWRHAVVDRLALGLQDNPFPFTLVEQGHLTLGALLTLLNFVDHVVWGVLSLVAILALQPHRTKNVAGDNRDVG